MRRAGKLLTTAGIALLLAGLPLPAVHAEGLDEDKKAETITVYAPVELDRNVSFQDALLLGESSDLNIVGYRYENYDVVGEYFPGSRDPQVFLNEFEKDFGTEPQVSGLIAAVEKPVSYAQTREGVAFNLQVPPGIETFRSVPSYAGSAWDELKESRKSEVVAPFDGDAALQTATWEPNFAEFGTKELPDNRAMIWERYVWNVSSGHHPVYRDLDWGLEFEIKQHNSSPIWIGQNRPFCALTNYKLHFWAINQAYDWTVYAPYGDLTTIGAYADTNDLSDACAEQTMSIGFKNPGQVWDDGYGYTELAILINAPGGTLAESSPISGYIDTVDSYSCDPAPWNGTPHTDCMGLDYNATYPGPGPASYATLDVSRGYIAPDSCWNTYFDAQVLPDSTVGHVWKFDCTYLFG